MAEQDWNQVVWDTTENNTKGVKKEKILNSARQKGVTIVAEQKYFAGQNKSAHTNTGKNLKSIADDTENLRNETVTLTFRQRLMKARQAKSMTQKDLAIAIAEKQGVINEYESGKAIPNPNIINKMEKVLGCRLRDPKKK